MVNFAELKAKAEKAKDVSVTKMSNTRDRYKSVPSSKVSWDPNWKRAPPSAAGTSASAAASGGPPPPPVRVRPDVTASGGGVASPMVPRASRPTDTVGSSASPYTPLPPPTRAASGYSRNQRESSPDVVDRVDWANLSAGDKAAFFEWLDEFFSRYLGIEVGAGERKGAVLAGTRTVPPVVRRPPPLVNKTTRPQV